MSRARIPIAVIAAGILATGLGYPRTIGNLPIGLLLKNQLGLGAEELATFWAVGTAAWYLKPLVGLFEDRLPLAAGGARGRGYLLLGSATAAAGWAAFALVPRSPGWLLAAMVVTNLGLVVASTAVGGIIVEAGQRAGATGRLSALRTGLDAVMALVAGPLGGVLAAAPAFGWTAATGAALTASLIPVALAGYGGGPAPLAAAPTAPPLPVPTLLRRTLGERGMLLALAFTFLVFVTPGLQTPLFFYRQDVLGFDIRFMSFLQTAGSLGLLGGAILYGWLCRRLPLRATLIIGISLSAGGTLLLFGYRSAGTALAIDAANGFFGALVLLPMFDLAARATPRGAESFGYALLLAVQSFAQYGLSDPLGSFLYEGLRLGLRPLIAISAASTALALLFVPLLPRALLARREAATPAAYGDV